MSENVKRTSEAKVGEHLGWAIIKRVNSPHLTISGWFDGRRFRESVKSDRMDTARKLIRKRVGELAKRGKLLGPEVERTTYADVEAMLIADVEANRRASYLESTKYRVRHLRRWFGPNKLAREISYMDLCAYKAARLKVASPSTVRSELMLMGRALRLAVMAERLETVVPLPSVHVSNAKTGFCSPAEIASVCERLPEHVAPVVRLLYLTGMRSGEALGLEWSRVDFDAGVIALRAEDTKTGRARSIPFADLRPLVDLLRAQREKVSAMERAQSRVIVRVFPDVAPVTLKRRWLKAVKAAGLPGLRCHDLRRSFVRNAIRSGVPEGVTMALVGHTSRAMLDRYNIVNTEDRSDGMAKLGAFLARPAKKREA